MADRCTVPLKLTTKWNFKESKLTFCRSKQNKMIQRLQFISKQCEVGGLDGMLMGTTGHGLMTTGAG